MCRLHAMAAVDFQFFGNDACHGYRWMGIVAEHQADLDVSTAFGQAIDGVETSLSVTERIDRDMGTSAGDIADSRRGIEQGGVQQEIGSEFARRFQAVGLDVQGDDLCAERFGDHDRRESDAATSMDGDPLVALQLGLVDQRAKCGDESAAQACGEIDRIGQGDQVGIGASDQDLVGKSSPVGESWLGVVIADMGVAQIAFGARAASAAERDRHALPDAESSDQFADTCDDSREFVAWYMGQLDIGIVAHPGVPIAAADSASFQFDHRIGIACDGQGDLLDSDWALEAPEDSSAHGVGGLGGRFGQFGRFVGKDACFDRATAFADGVGVVDPDGDLSNGALNDAFEVGFP